MYGTNNTENICTYRTPCGLCMKYDKDCDVLPATDKKVLSTKLVKMIYDFSRGRIYTDTSRILEYIQDHLEKECPDIDTWGDD